MIGMAKGFLITLRKGLERPLTVQYPLEQLPMPPRSRNSFRMTVDEETGELKCKVCELCAKSCPENAIAYEAEEVEVEGKKRRRLTRFDVDLGRCMYCGICVEQCPSDALENTGEYEFACRTPSELTKDLLAAARAAGQTVKDTRGGGS